MISDPVWLYDEAARLTLEGRFSEAELMLRQAVELAGEDSELYVAALATLLGLQDGRAEEANALILAEMAVHPDSPNLLVAYGLTARHSGDAQAAADAFKKALETNPNHPMALHSMAQVLVDKGKIAEAQKLACRAFALVPDHAQFALTAVELLEAQGQTEMAYDVATLGASFNPDEMELVKKSVEGALARQEPEVAWDTLESSTDQYPWVIGWRATLLDYAGKVEEADALLSHGRKKFGDHPEFVFLEAAIWHRRGELELSSDFLDWVLELDPTHKGALQLKANIGPLQRDDEPEPAKNEQALDEVELMALYYTTQRYQECLDAARDLRLRSASDEAVTFECLSLATLGQTERALKLSAEVPLGQVQSAIEVLTTHGRGGPGEEAVRNRLLERLPQKEAPQQHVARLDLNTSDYEELEDDEEWIEVEEDEDGKEYVWVEVDEDDDDPDAEYDDEDEEYEED